MHHAPSVVTPVGRCLFADRLWWVQGGLSLGLCTAWIMAQPFHWIPWLTLCALLGLAGLGRPARAAQPGRLRWDGMHWFWEPTPHGPGEGGAELGQIDLVFDIQIALLLKWQPLSSTLGGRKQWFWLTPATCQENWLALRRAVHRPQIHEMR